MGVYLGRSVFSGTLLFFFLGLIFCVVGYIGKWLAPRFGVKPNVYAVGVREACFQEYTALQHIANIPKLNDCIDTTKTSQVFAEVSDKKYVSPDWYREVQDMHLATLIMMLIALILAISFLVSYCMLDRQLKKRIRPSSAVLLSKAGLSLWFILPFICGLLQIAGPTHFLYNYEREPDPTDFLRLHKDEYEYGEGFYITFVAGGCLLLSSVLGFIVSVNIMRKMMRLSSGDAKDEFATMDPQDTELERLSNDLADSDDGTTIRHKPAYPTAAPRKSVSRIDDDDEQERSYRNIPKSRSEREIEQAPASAGQPYQNLPTSRPKPVPRSSSTGTNPVGLVKPYGQQGQGQTTPSMAGESRMSTEAPSSVFTTTYNYGYRDSDTESQRSARNKTSTRYGGPAPNHRQITVPEPRAIDVSQTAGAKNKKYTAY